MMTPRVFLAAAAGVGLVSCSGLIGGGELQETAEANAVVDALRAQLGPAGHSLQARALRLWAEGAEVQARFEGPRPAAHPATLSMPRAAGGPISLADESGQVSVRLRLRDTVAVSAEAGRGHVVYRNALAGGGHIVARMTPTGAEDYLMLPGAPRAPVVYDVELTRGVAGLRQLGQALEVLDADGTPRLRVAPPWIQGADGVRVAASLRVGECAVDVDPRLPFHRAGVTPGARRCTLTVAWDAAQVRYPAVLDPAWSTTGDLIIGREAHTATRLPNGMVLIAGGASGDPVALSEIYDPATGTFAAAAPTMVDHVSATATLIDQGGRTRVLLAGGQSWLPAQAEAYDYLDGTWVSAGQMATVRYGHTASALASGQVLVAGGYDLFGNLVTGTELFNPKTNSWSLAGYLNDPRQGHIAFVDAAGALVIAGGNGASGMLAAAEVYDPLAWKWTRVAAENLMVPRSGAGAVALAGGGVLVAGGTGMSGALASAELYDPAMGRFISAGTLSQAAAAPSLAALPNGSVLALGAVNDLFDPATGTWIGVAAASSRSGATLTTLADGSVLVAGGRSSANGQIEILGTAERFRLGTYGEACTATVACASNVCTDGTCGCPVGQCCGDCDAAPTIDATVDAAVDAADMTPAPTIDASDASDATFDAGVL